MPHLLESTKNYLRSSTKIGRRMSTSRDDSSVSEASLTDLSPVSPVSITTETVKQHRPSPQNRLSSIFTLEGRNRSSSEDRATVNVLSRKVGPEAQDQQHDNKKKRRNSGSQKSILSIRSQRQPSPQSENRASVYSSTTHVSTARSRKSYYDVNPTDYPTTDQYQSHVWHRTILEESIMHSLKLGYGERRSGSENRSRSDSRSRSDPRALKRINTSHSGMSAGAPDSETVVDRGMPSPAAHPNSPYQMHANSSSTANITHSYAIFTLELPEHQVTQVISSSAVPNLFQINKGGLDNGQSKVRRESNASRFLHTGPTPSPRVLTGKTIAEQAAASKENTDPLHMYHPVVAAV
ncbi:hypothetical protein BX616_005335 [Lobosporangium transversale]|uniref:Uncharacterized protein n=1 Tax=Lobosporangium transversale TaxID=64571 RepID=A0A1Y2GTQ5_9FUNG|nr:hypothetical protein BCR41DRAFT_17500 [Lobosporangium transversale]KAF9897573.1 hypothetical protein BX616_005335 [Lobosporangium transversale]ORZ22897.1 hypothetical protein BCR41DRAFT_17500 [Lobosporangium transversale]|eukprot:XP_021883451.1 hypothetical protein BCR41DRAFT_17500 [Lobosporangium transversale]